MYRLGNSGACWIKNDRGILAICVDVATSIVEVGGVFMNREDVALVLFLTDSAKRSFGTEKLLSSIPGRCASRTPARGHGIYVLFHLLGTTYSPLPRMDGETSLRWGAGV